jgi:hypothetical protein
MALVALAFSPEAAAQTTTWTGSGDADPISALQWEGDPDTVTATASGYEFTVSATDTDGAGGAAGLTDVAPQDWTFTVDFGTDLVTAANDGYILCGIWAGEVTSGDFWADQPRQIWVEFTVGGDYTVESDSPTSVNDSITVTADPGTMSFRLSQSGDTITMEYTEPGSTSFLTLGTDDALDTASDFGVIMMPYAGVGFDEGATVLIETVTLTLGGGAPAGGGCGAALEGTGEDTEGYDICLTGTIAAGEEVTVTMFDDTGAVVDPEWWELGTRTEQGWVGDYTYIGDSPTFTLDQAMLDGSLEFINGDPEVFVHYNGDDLCECAGVEPPEPEGPCVNISGDHTPLVGADLLLEGSVDCAEEYTSQWSKDGEVLEGETGDELFLPAVQLDDSGTYTLVVTYDGGGGDAAYAEAERSFYVWVTEAGLPLAGGLGLGLLAGACALAGAVSIRRKK